MRPILCLLLCMPGCASAAATLEEIQARAWEAMSELSRLKLGDSETDQKLFVSDVHNELERTYQMFTNVKWMRMHIALMDTRHDADILEGLEETEISNEKGTLELLGKYITSTIGDLAKGKVKDDALLAACAHALKIIEDVRAIPTGIGDEMTMGHR